MSYALDVGAAPRLDRDVPQLDAEQRAQRTSSLRLMVLWTLAIGTLALLALIVLEPPSAGRRAGSIAVLWFGAGSTLALSRYGFTRSASALFVGLLIALVTQRAWHLGGIHAPLGPGYVVFAMMASALLGARAGAMAAGVCLLCGALLVFADHAGLLPREQSFSDVARLLYLAMFMGIALVVQHLIARELGASLDRVQAELASRQRAQRHLSLALDAGRIALWEQDPLTRQLHGNARLFELYGLPPSADGRLSWEAWRALVHPDDRQAVDARFAELERGAPQVSAEFGAVRPDGELRYLQGAAGLLTGEHGAPARFVGVNLDITGLKRAQLEQQQLVAMRTAELVASRDELAQKLEQLRGLEQVRDDLVHMIVHDMRAPLTAMSLNLRFLCQSLPKEHAETFVDLISSADVLTRLANTVLDVSRLEHGSMPLDRSRCDLTRLATEVRDALAPLDTGRRIELLSTGTVIARCDASVIRRVLENLISNGMKHTPEGGRLSIELHAGDGVARVAVQDEGPGVPEDARQRIFEKFGALKARDEGAYHSVGLGLAFCKLAVQAHGGTIGVSSASPRGSQFWFELPT